MAPKKVKKQIFPPKPGQQCQDPNHGKGPFCTCTKWR